MSTDQSDGNVTDRETNSDDDKGSADEDSVTSTLEHAQDEEPTEYQVTPL